MLLHTRRTISIGQASGSLVQTYKHSMQCEKWFNLNECCGTVRQSVQFVIFSCCGDVQWPTQKAIYIDLKLGVLRLDGRLDKEDTCVSRAAWTFCSTLELLRLEATFKPKGRRQRRDKGAQDTRPPQHAAWRVCRSLVMGFISLSISACMTRSGTTTHSSLSIFLPAIQPKRLYMLLLVKSQTPE